MSDLVAQGALRVEDGNHGNDRPRPSEFVDEGVAFIRAADMTSGVVNFATAGKINDVARARIRKGVGAPGDVLLSHKGTVGKVAIVPADAPEFVCSPQTTFWRSLDSTRIDQRFLRYIMLSPDFSRQLTVFKSQTDMAPYVSLTDQRAIELELPSILEQGAIADVLVALDNKISANERASRTAVSLLDALHQQALEKEGTTFQAFFDVFEVDFGEAFRGDQFTGPGVGRPLIRIRDLKSFQPQLWTRESRANEMIMQPGDVLVGMDAEFRATWWLGEPGLLNQRVCRVRGRGFGAAFVAEALRLPLAAIENEKTGTTVIHLNKADLARAEVAVPGSSALAEFESLAEPILMSYVAMAGESRRLHATRDALLPLLLSGRVGVRHADEIVGNTN